MATATKANEKVELSAIEVVNANVLIEGTSPLIVHRFSEKAKKMMLDKQMKKARQAKAAKNPQQDYEDSLYRTDDGGYGFPSVGFKAAVVRAGTYSDFKMTFLRGALHVPGELVTIDGEPKMREDIVRLQGNTADIRYRGEFIDWRAAVPITFNARVITIEQILQLFKVAGFAVGVGEWRPEKNGQYGRFDVIGAEA